MASALLKTIFYVDYVAQTKVVREAIVGWLKEFNIKGNIGAAVKTYTSQLTDSTRGSLQAQFNEGDIRVLVCTITFAIGVNLS